MKRFIFLFVYHSHTPKPPCPSPKGASACSTLSAIISSISPVRLRTRPAAPWDPSLSSCPYGHRYSSKKLTQGNRPFRLLHVFDREHTLSNLVRIRPCALRGFSQLLTFIIKNYIIILVRQNKSIEYLKFREFVYFHIQVPFIFLDKKCHNYVTVT